MLKSIGVGSELFHKLIESDCYYVDKTLFIRTVFQDNQSDVMLITRLLFFTLFDLDSVK